jgi:nucleoid-associated protein YgaU
MNSDAKLGLLLGLVFIFIIAFAINGLPRFRSTTNGSELTTNMVNSQDSTLGIGDNEREVQNLIDWPQPPIENPQPLNETAQMPLEDDEGVRYKMKLPETFSYSPIIETAEEPEPALFVPVEPANEETTESTLVELFDPPPPEQPKEEKIEIQKPKPKKRVSPKVYVVSDGDNLAKIAKKIYGIEEGNKRANIMRIFELNSGLLPSPDELRIGQQLIIPPLIRSGTDRSMTDRKEPSSFLEKFESFGRKVLQPDKPKTTPARPGNTQNSSGGRQYVVKEGDSLWQIAVKQLGDGSRYKEIVKLNTGTLEDENSLSIGMQLKLPTR